MNKVPLNKGVIGNSAVDLGRRDTLKAIGAGTMAAGTSLIGSGAAPHPLRAVPQQQRARAGPTTFSSSSPNRRAASGRVVTDAVYDV
jgi:hypothetical protein